MVGTDQKKHAQHQFWSSLKGDPSHSDTRDIGEDKRLAKRPFWVPMHVGMQYVVQGAMLDANNSDQNNGEGQLEVWSPMPECLAHESTSRQKTEGPPPHLDCILECACPNHGAKKRPTPEKGWASFPCFRFGEISP